MLNKHFITEEEKKERALYETAYKLVTMLGLLSTASRPGAYIDRMKNRFDNISNLKARHFNNLKTSNPNYYNA